jgi:hypothetical protein
MARPGRANAAAHTDRPSKEAGPADASSMDAGGGFGGLVVPVGVYVVKDDQVRWVSAVDVTIAVLASVGLVRTLARSWTRRPRRSGRPGLYRTQTPPPRGPPPNSDLIYHTGTINHYPQCPRLGRRATSFVCGHGVPPVPCR